MSLKNELCTRAAEKTQSDERLKQDSQHLMIQVHQQLFEIDTAISTISSMQAECRPRRNSVDPKR